MAELVATSTAALVAAEATAIVVVKALSWFKVHAKQYWHRLQRWWGGKAKEMQIWSAYKEGRDIIMKEKRHLHHDLKLLLIQDLRTDFRLKYPAHENMFN